MDRPVLVAKARALERTGKPWRRIGEILGVEYSKLHRWVKQADKAEADPIGAATAKTRLKRTTGSPEQKARSGEPLPRIPDAREREFAKGLLEGKTRVAAAKDAMSDGTSKSAASSWAAKTAADDGFKAFFLEVLAASGVTPEKLATTHASLLGADKFVAGKMVPDNAARNAALKLGYEVMGLAGQQQAGGGSGNVTVQIDSKAAKTWAVLCGGKLPAGVEVIDVTPEPEPEQLAAAGD